ncbi:MAG TPA: hypothetical protein VHE99_07445 [Gammaproteobacteria bacterium]|nr:hypothetical protein [Gammaproteobacteria bacterium]
MSSANSHTNNNQVASLQAELDQEFPEPLKMALQAHGFSLEQQLGILRLFKIYQIQIPNKFHSPVAYGLEEVLKANDWLIAATQTFLRKGERWAEDNSSSEEKISEFKDLLLEASQLFGLTEEQIPNFKSLGSQLVIIPGGLEARVALRCHAVIQDIQDGNSHI